MAYSLDAVVMDQVARHLVGLLLVVHCQGVDKVCLVVIKGIDTLVPLFHDETVWNLQTS